MTTADDALARLTSDSVMPPTPVEMTLTPDRCRSTACVSAFAIASTEPCTSALSTILTSLTSPALILSRMFSSDTRPLPASSFLRLRASCRCSTSALAAFSSLTTLKISPASGTPSRPSTSTGVDGPASVIAWPLSPSMARIFPVVLARPRPDRRGAACLPRPGWSRSRRARDRGAPRRRAPCAALFGLALQLEHLGLQGQHLEQLVDALLGLGRHVRRRSSSPPHSSGTRSCSDSLVRIMSGLAPGLSILLTATTIGTSRLLGVVDRLDGLRHRPVVGRDHQDDDVGHLGAARAHGGERLVAGRIQEHDVAAVAGHLVGADVLGDAARLARRDVGLADGVEQRRLAVVDVAHDRDDRRARQQVLRVLRGRVAAGQQLVLAERRRFDLEAELGRDQRRGVEIDVLVDVALPSSRAPTAS